MNMPIPPIAFSLCHFIGTIASYRNNINPFNGIIPKVTVPLHCIEKAPHYCEAFVISQTDKL